MPRPTLSDPNYCEGSEGDDYTLEYGWWVCGRCRRVLKMRGAHRVRSRTTASIDKLRDQLHAAGLRPGGGS